MKYIIGSLILSFGAVFVLLAILMAIQIQRPDNVFEILAAVWFGLAILLYPVARKIVR